MRFPDKNTATRNSIDRRATKDFMRKNPFRRKLQQVWYSMKDRCHRIDNNSFPNYGGKGIKICKRWLDFENFYKDMITSFKPGLSIDRIDSKGNYEPKNCRWATKIQQENNRRNNHTIEYKGIKDTLSNWARFIGIKVGTLNARLNQYHWSIEKSLTKGGCIENKIT